MTTVEEQIIKDKLDVKCKEFVEETLKIMSDFNINERRDFLNIISKPEYKLFINHVVKI